MQVSLVIICLNHSIYSFTKRKQCRRRRQEFCRPIAYVVCFVSKYVHTNYLQTIANSHFQAAIVICRLSSLFGIHSSV